MALLALAMAAWFTGCGNPACIFGAGCLDGDSTGDGGDVNGATANVAFPIDGEWIVPGTPSIIDTFPKDDATITSPIVLVFSESLNPSTALDGFEFEREDGTPEAGGPVASLVGDGRVLIIFPAAPFTPGQSYVVRFAEGAEVTDLTGVPITQPVDGIVTTFTSATVPTTTPALVMSYPAANSTGQSTVGEIVTVFDRQLDDLTVDETSFVVGLSDQALEPAISPEPLLVSDLGSFEETRVYLWRRTDAAGNTVALPNGANVLVDLSPEGGPQITDEADMVLPPTQVQFGLAPFGVPLGGSLASAPGAAIGIDNLVGTLNPLMMLVEFDEPAQAGDQLDVLVFGIKPIEDEDELPSNIVFERSVALPEGETAVLIERDTLALVETADPLTTIVDDGQVAFAYRYSRGGVVSPVRLLDTAPLTQGIQDVILDTVAPQLVGIGASGSEGSEFRSELFDMALIGRANEELAAVEVAVTLAGGKVLSNGALAETTGSNEAGLFVAAPIPGGSFPDEASLSATLNVRLYDRALNASPEVEGTYVRTGGVAFTPGGTTLQVHAYDADTGQSVSGARCFVHTRTEDGPFSQPDAALFDQAATGATGDAFLTIDPTRLNSVTVDADGYDLFTLQGAAGGTLAVPLVPVEVQLPPEFGLSQLTVTTNGADVPTYTSQAADSRFVPPTEVLIDGQECTVNPFTNAVTCTFVPWSVELGRIGALSWFATDPALSAVSFDAQDFLRAFAFGYPQAAVVDTETIETTSFNVPVLLAEEADPSEHAVAASEYQFDRNNIAGQASVSIPPQVLVETVSPGVSDRVVVGRGTTFDMNNDLVYDVRAAFPGAVDPFVSGEGDAPGRLVMQGAVADRLFLSVSSIDPSGSITTVRSILTGSAPAAPLVPMGIPVLSQPASGLLPGPAFTAVFSAVLPDANAGIYSATLSEQPLDSSVPARSWRLFRLKPAGEALGSVAVYFPPIGASGGVPLTAPAQTIELGAITTEGFSPDAFRWVELELEASLESRSDETLLVLVP